MKKILANDGLSPAGVAILERAGYAVITEHILQDDLAAAINVEGYEVLLVRSATKVRRDLIDACPGLKMIGRGGVGMDNIDVDYARSKGIEVVNTPAASSQSVAELVMAHLFNTARFVHISNREMPVKGCDSFASLKKKYGKGIELRGKTLGIIGFGRIGQNLARYALGIGMKVLVVDRHPEDTFVEIPIFNAFPVKVKIVKVGINELLEQSDFISLHIPAQPSGPVIGASEFAKMKDGVRIINAARGGVMDEEALLAAIDSGKVSFAGIDVFENEPTPRQDLLSKEQISLTPHIGAATVEAQERIGEELADIIISHFGSTA